MRDGAARHYHHGYLEFCRSQSNIFPRERTAPRGNGNAEQFLSERGQRTPNSSYHPCPNLLPCADPVRAYGPHLTWRRRSSAGPRRTADQGQDDHWICKLDKGALNESVMRAGGMSPSVASISALTEANCSPKWRQIPAQLVAFPARPAVISPSQMSVTSMSAACSVPSLIKASRQSWSLTIWDRGGQGA